VDPADAARLDAVLAQIRKTGRTGELHTPRSTSCEVGHEYFAQNCWVV